MEIIYNNLKVSLPDAIIVGAAKAGTTSLFNYLSDHPQIFKPRIKEPWFFSFRGKKPQFIIPNSGRVNSKEIISNDQEYFDLFKNSDKYLIEGSTSYLYTAKDTIKNIKDLYGEDYSKLKIIIVLRNPIERAWSHYMMHVRDNKTDLSFTESIKEEAIRNMLSSGGIIGYDYIGFGMYYNQIKLFKDVFPELKILMYDDFLRSPLDYLNQLTDFLSIDRFSFHTSQKYNASGSPKNGVSKLISSIINRDSYFKSFIKGFLPKGFLFKLSLSLKPLLYRKVKISSKEKNSLIEIYREEVLKLEKLIGYDLKHWLN